MAIPDVLAKAWGGQHLSFSQLVFLGYFLCQTSGHFPGSSHDLVRHGPTVTRRGTPRIFGKLRKKNCELHGRYGSKSNPQPKTDWIFQTWAMFANVTWEMLMGDMTRAYLGWQGIIFPSLCGIILSCLRRACQYFIISPKHSPLFQGNMAREQNQVLVDMSTFAVHVAPETKGPLFSGWTTICMIGWYIPKYPW